MFSVVLFAALMAGENTADFHYHHGCYGAIHSCYGGCYGSCYGWSHHFFHSHSHHCYGCWGCYGCSGCYGCGGCYGCSGCYGGCWGAPYAGYGPLVGHVGYYGPVIYTPVYTAPVITVPAVGGEASKSKSSTDKSSSDRALVIFKLPEGAKLFVENQLIANAAEQKTFRTPVLESGKNYVYSLRIESEKDGEKLVGESTLQVRAGRTEEVDLTTVELKKETKVAAR